MRPEVHRYGPDRSHFCERFTPRGDGPFAVVVLLHGGFWRARYDRTLAWPLAADLLERGRAVWNIEYRRLGNGGGWPETFEDVAAALDLLAALDDERLDLSAPVAVGHSAGGQLALWAAGRAGLPDDAPGAGPRLRLAGAVAQAGVVDLAEAARLRLSDGVVLELLGGGPEERQERYALASPAERLPLGVRSLVVTGSEDGTVPPALSEAYAAAAQAAGDDCELAVVPGEGHLEHLEPGSQVWRAVTEWLG